MLVLFSDLLGSYAGGEILHELDKYLSVSSHPAYEVEFSLFPPRGPENGFVMTRSYPLVIVC